MSTPSYALPRGSNNIKGQPYIVSTKGISEYPFFTGRWGVSQTGTKSWLYPIILNTISFETIPPKYIILITKPWYEIGEGTTLADVWPSGWFVFKSIWPSTMSVNCYRPVNTQKDIYVSCAKWNILYKLAAGTVANFAFCICSVGPQDKPMGIVCLWINFSLWEQTTLLMCLSAKDFETVSNPKFWNDANFFFINYLPQSM